MSAYIESDYIEEDYYEEETMAVTPLPAPPLRSDAPAIFIEKADQFLSALPPFALELEALGTAMNNNSTSATSTTSNTIASSGSKTFTVQALKGFLPGQTIKAASTANGTVWMQGDVTAYNSTTGILSITMNASQGAGTIAAWTLSLATSTASSPGSLSQDYAVKSLQHAIGSDIASASTINLSTATGNMVKVTGNVAISAATMTAGKDVWVVFTGTPQLNYHVSNHQLNSNGGNITASAGGYALYTYDGVTVRVLYFSPSGRANVETAPPAGAPVGSFLLFAGSSPPTSYLTCPTTQTNINRTTYATLFTAIGTTWGVGDSSTTFGMPWFAADYAMLQASSNVGSASTGTIKAHTHDIPTYESETGSGGLTPGGPTLATTVATASTGGSANLAAGARVLICVKYQ